MSRCFFCHDYSGFSRLKVLLWKGSRRQAERGLHAGGRKNIDQIEARAPGSLSAGRFGTEVKMKDYAEYIAEQAQKLLAIDSPSGYTKNAAQYLCGVYRKLGYEPQLTVKGGVLVKLCEGTGAVPEAEGTGYGDPSRGPILLMAHTDTLGAMVSGITPEGRLKLTPLGGLNPNNTEAENCRIITRKGKVYTGTFQLANASIHVNGDYNEKKRSYDNMEVLVDEPVKNADDVKRLGIMTGDIVCFDPRTTVTPSGYIKSRFLDDKLSTAILLGYAAYLKEEKISPERTVYEHITVFEEVGHGACASVPEKVTELLSVDMGCVGEGLSCTEHQVSICSKDSHGPYHYDVVGGLIDAADRTGVDYAVDVYPHYGSDADAALDAGIDARHGLIGPGVYASHGYERSHRDGVRNTFELLKAYLG